jgi:anti-anti-sigma factor
VQLDLTAVDYLSSAGLEVLRDAAASIRDAGGTLTLVAVSEPVSVALKLAGEVPHLQFTIHN